MLSSVCLPLAQTWAQVLEFDWRSAFKGLVPQMEHCVKVVLDDVCAKSLQQEEALYSAGHTSIDLCSTRGHCSTTHTKEDSFYTYSEDTPKMIAKVLSHLKGIVDFLNMGRNWPTGQTLNMPELQYMHTQ